jgi:hypothetical protein
MANTERVVFGRCSWQMGRGGNKALEELRPRNHAEIRWLPAIHWAKALSAQGSSAHSQTPQRQLVRPLGFPYPNFGVV